MTDELLNTTQVALMFGLTRGRITQLIHDGVIPARKWGRDYQIKPADLAELRRIRGVEIELPKRVAVPRTPPKK